MFTIASSDTGEATVSPATLTFTPATWNVAQPVTVTGVSDDTVDGSQTSTITISVDDAASDDSFDAETFTTLDGIREAAADRGLRLLYMLGSTDREWDRYEMLQSLAADAWAEANPEHADRDHVLEEDVKAKRAYLQQGRDTLGFAQFLFRRVGYQDA